MTKQQKGTLLVFLASVLYSLGGICMKGIPWNGMAVNGGRTAIAVVVMAIYLWLTKQKLRWNRWIFLGALSVSCTNILFSVANKMTTAANAIVLQYTAPIFVIVLTALFLHKRPGRLDLAACAVVFGGVLLGISVIMDRRLGRESLGGGDIKLFAVTGLYLGFAGTLFTVLLSCILGLAVYAAVLRKNKSGQAFPFGPSIAAAAAVMLLFGDWLISWYTNLL